MIEKQLEQRIKVLEKRKEELNKEVTELENRLKSISKMPAECLYCEGTGQKSYTDAAGSRDYKTCPVCGGIGKVAPLTCRRCNNKIPTYMIHARKSETPIMHCPWCGARIPKW